MGERVELNRLVQQARRAHERLARTEKQMACVIAAQRETRDQLVRDLIDRGLDDGLIARGVGLRSPDIADIRVSRSEAAV